MRYAVGLERAGWEEEEESCSVDMCLQGGWLGGPPRGLVTRGLIHSSLLSRSLPVWQWRHHFIWSRLSSQTLNWEPLCSLIHGSSVRINTLRTRWCSKQPALKATRLRADIEIYLPRWDQNYKAQSSAELRNGLGHHESRHSLQRAWTRFRYQVSPQAEEVTWAWESILNLLVLEPNTEAFCSFTHRSCAYWKSLLHWQ